MFNGKLSQAFFELDRKIDKWIGFSHVVDPTDGKEFSGFTKAIILVFVFGLILLILVGKISI